MTTSPLALIRPDELDSLDLTRSAVVEASAGTGKTYLLEHLVLDLLIRGQATLEQILVVTFTERATAELVARIRRKIDHALGATGAGVVPVVGWTLDSAARLNLEAARRSFDRATIATIHGFCQGILTDEPFATRRLLGQRQIEGRQIFGQAFRGVLRRTLTTDPAHRPYLETYLAAGQGVERLETLLFGAATGRGRWKNPFDERALDRALALLARVNVDAPGFDKAARAIGSARYVRRYLEDLRAQAGTALAAGDRARFLDYLDRTKQLKIYFNKSVKDPAPSELLQPFQDFSRALLAAAPPLDEAVAQRFLPLVLAEVSRHKLSEGLYDYDDMINGVDEALAGEAGAALVERLRDRYRYALVDEAQDTEPAQWRIFKRVFLESDRPNPVVLIGDPKQAIYGFRGADVHTYVAACRDIAAGGAASPVTLTRNHRATPEVIAPLNAILEQEAFAPFFDEGDIRYDQPVVATRPADGSGPGITLLRVDPPAEQRKPRIGEIRAALRNAIAEVITGLSTSQPDLRLTDIAILTRSNADGRDMAARLRQDGIPSTLFKAEYLFESAEAGALRALLAAVADPNDRVARLNAWLTPFFAVDLDTLAADSDPPRDHPLVARLLRWAALADQRAYARLWPAIMNDSGITRRLRLSPAGLRALTNFRHLLDRLQALASERPISIGELSALLAMLGAGHRRSADMDDDTQRIETEADAVRIMTIHAAKGLEAEVVFVYGGLTGRNFWKGCTNHLHDGGERLIVAGDPRADAIRERIALTRRQEERRLQYVAMTRARQRLYLPFFPLTEFGEPPDREAGDFDAFKTITGEYRHVNERLRRLDGDPARARLFATRMVRLDAEATGTAAPALTAPPPVGTAWVPPPGLAAVPDSRADEAAALRAHRRGFVITSYSRLKEGAHGGAGNAHGANEPFEPSEMWHDDPEVRFSADPDDPTADQMLAAVESLDTDIASSPEGAAGAAAAPSLEASRAGGDLPGGTASGLFLHGVLEKIQLGPLPPLDEWRRLPDVRRLIEAELRRWDREPRHLDAAAALVHAALTTPLDLPGAPALPGLTRAARVRREVGFLFPLPGAAATGFVRGFLDVLFEHDGRVWFADWKSDVLPAYTDQALRDRVRQHYDLQVRIYTMATARLLGIASREDYDRRFGGVAYLFLRGLPAGGGAGIHAQRPGYDDLRRWEEELGSLPLASGGLDPTGNVDGMGNMAGSMAGSMATLGPGGAS